MMMLMVQLFMEGTSVTHRWVPLPKIYFSIVHCLKLVKSQIKIVGTYMLQLSTVDSNLLQVLPFLLLQGSYSSDYNDGLAVKIMTNDVKALYMVFLGTLGSIFWKSL